jgi:glycosyltransferase involved in cell wall biosynthesis
MRVFNAERFLRESIESILHQSLWEFEFVITDDGSTDASASILAEYERGEGACAVSGQLQV